MDSEDEPAHGAAYAHRGMRRGAAALLVALSIIGVSACGTETGSRPEVAEPKGWSPWQTSFHGGGRDDGPSGDANACTRGPGPGGLLHCDGTRFRDEPLKVGDGTHHPEGHRPGHRAGFARADGLVFTSGEAKPPAGEDGALGGERRVRALDAESGEERWEHPVRTGAIHHAGRIIGNEPTEITNRPEDGDYEDWTPAYEPGGDLVVRDARSGEEQRRLKTPKDQWCAPAEVAGRAFVTCEDDRYGQGDVTWYRLDGAAPSAPSMGRLSVQKGGEEEPELVGMDGGSLVFLPPVGAFARETYEEVVRVDSTTGEERREPLPDTVRPGAEPHLIDGDLYFEQAPKESRSSGESEGKPDQELLAVDATTGEERWKRSTSMEYPSEPVVSTRREEVYLADPAGRLTVLDRRTGEERRRTEEPRAEDGGTRPGEMDALSSLTLVRDVLVVSTGNTVFSVSPEDPEAEPARTTEVRLH